MIYGLRESTIEEPDYQKALEQHKNYVETLKQCNVNRISVLEADDDYPDSCFVEDTAVLTKTVAIITNPGAQSRKGEIKKVGRELQRFYDTIHHIEKPGTLDGGDVMMTGDHFYIGLSGRTNDEGADQLIDVLVKYGYSGSKIKCNDYLHLKTGMSYIENNILLAAGAFKTRPEFEKFDIIKVPDKEAYAANSIWVNGKIIMPSGYPETQTRVEEKGCTVITVDMSEFKKLNGGVSCLSLRF